MMMKALVSGAAAILLAAQPAVAHPGHGASAGAADEAKAGASQADKAAVTAVLAQYQAAMERLDPRGTEQLFSKDSMIFETGGSEGTYAHYLAHHLTPELGEFKSFKFGNYKLDVRFEGPLALANETYTYRIETKKGDVAERVGAATSVLRKENGRWKIIMSHNSSRRPSAQ